MLSKTKDIACLTLSQTTNLRLFKTNRICRQQFKGNGGNFSSRVENAVGKEKLLFVSNFSFSHRVFK